ncbi:MAG: ABC transporter permease [Candidatus Stahlbacteria bacterium]|nr:MAG: ABC transporter permease [Candidatus Stahlbacteria bacterium]
MHRIWAIVENTFKESLRQRILMLLIIFSVLVIVVSVFLEPFALGEAPKILRDFGIAAASLFGVLIVIIIGSTLIHKDIEKRTIYTVITKPVKRSEIIIGKFLGLLLLIAILQCAMIVIHQLVIFIYEGSFDLPLFITIPFSLLEIMILLGILLLFSSFSSPTISAIMGIIFFVIGHASPDLKLFADQVNVAILKYLAYGFYYILPNLENFNLRIDLVYKLPIHLDQLLFSICYGLIYTIFLLYVSIIIFEKREFK